MTSYIIDINEVTTVINDTIQTMMTRPFLLNWNPVRSNLGLPINRDVSVFLGVVNKNVQPTVE